MDRRRSKTDLGIGNALAVHVTTNLDAAEAPDKEVEETRRAIDEEIVTVLKPGGMRMGFLRA